MEENGICMQKFKGNKNFYAIDLKRSNCLFFSIFDMSEERGELGKYLIPESNCEERAIYGVLDKKGSYLLARKLSPLESAEVKDTIKARLEEKCRLGEEAIEALDKDKLVKGTHLLLILGMLDTYKK